jgi:GNAT superfamily N-acetyltransferase
MHLRHARRCAVAGHILWGETPVQRKTPASDDVIASCVPGIEAVRVRRASTSEITAIQATRISASEDLTERFGEGHWSIVSSEATLIDALGNGNLYVIDADGVLAGTCRLTDRKIAFYEERWFADPDAPATYLRDMAIAPDRQRQGIGREAMADIAQLARLQGACAVRLDAYAGPAGAGTFYRKCGYSRMHAGQFNGVRLEYYEKLLSR